MNTKMYENPLNHTIWKIKNLAEIIEPRSCSSLWRSWTGALADVNIIIEKVKEIINENNLVSRKLHFTYSYAPSVELLLF